MSLRVWRHRRNFNKVAYGLLPFVTEGLLERRAGCPDWNCVDVLFCSEVILSNAVNVVYCLTKFDDLYFGRNLTTFR